MSCIYSIYLATLNDWCTVYQSDSYPDTCAIAAAYPQVVLWEVSCLPTHTTDGYCITTIEQTGEGAGEDRGRLWIAQPSSPAQRWLWYGHLDGAQRERLMALAERLTAAQFEAVFQRCATYTQMLALAPPARS